jgi:hypothetical protein
MINKTKKYKKNKTKKYKKRGGSGMLESNYGNIHKR